MATASRLDVLVIGSGASGLAALAPGLRITALSADAPESYAGSAQRYVQADIRAMPFADGEFDIGVSNAVVEHVGGADDQRAFIHELCRVSKRVFVTTPNRWFPIEVHTRLPLVHWLPDRASHRVYDLSGKPWAKENHLLGPGDLEALFPSTARIVNLGMTLVAIVA